MAKRKEVNGVEPTSAEAGPSSAPAAAEEQAVVNKNKRFRKDKRECQDSELQIRSFLYDLADFTSRNGVAF